jgi:hypothetical protein
MREYRVSERVGVSPAPFGAVVGVVAGVGVGWGGGWKMRGQAQCSEPLRLVTTAGVGVGAGCEPGGGGGCMGE